MCVWFFFFLKQSLKQKIYIVQAALLVNFKILMPSSQKAICQWQIWRVSGGGLLLPVWIWAAVCSILCEPLQGQLWPVNLLMKMLWSTREHQKCCTLPAFYLTCNFEKFHKDAPFFTTILHMLLTFLLPVSILMGLFANKDQKAITVRKENICGVAESNLTGISHCPERGGLEDWW